MKIYGTSGDDVLTDTGRRDKLWGGDGTDVFTLGRDGKRDFVMDFQDGLDLIDFSDFNVTFNELFIFQKSPYKFIIEIRGEKTTVNFDPAGPAPAIDALTADDFIFAPGAAEPGVNLIADTLGAEKLHGTGRPDVFLFVPDGARDAIRRFELGKDKIDLTAFDTNFADLDISTIRDGRIVIRFDTPGIGTERLVVNDRSHHFTHDEFTADDFIFA